MRCLFGCPDIVSLTEKFLMARNFYRIFTENNPVMGDSKTFGIPEAKGLNQNRLKKLWNRSSLLQSIIKDLEIRGSSSPLFNKQGVQKFYFVSMKQKRASDRHPEGIDC